MKSNIPFSFYVIQMGLASLLFIPLTACTPTLEPAAQADQTSTQATAQENTDPQLEIRWTAQVSRVERYQGSYQGEGGSATVQDGQVLELRLSNRAFTDDVGFYDTRLVSPPLALSYTGSGIAAGWASVSFEPSLAFPVVFAGEAETDFVLEDGFLTSSLRFTGRDDVGQEVDVVVEEIRVSY